jgi:hypothetical protein
VKSACTVISRFEQVVCAEAKRGGFDGVVCGHIHKAEQSIHDGVQYLNCGDWVESCTALVEHDDGRLEILDGLAFNEGIRQAKAEGREVEESDPSPEPALAIRSTELARTWNRIFAA